MNHLQNLKIRVSTSENPNSIDLKTIIQGDNVLSEEDLNSLEEIQERIEDAEVELEYNQRTIENMRNCVSESNEEDNENILFYYIYINIYIFFNFVLIPNNTQEAQTVIKVLYKYAIDLKEGGKRLKALVYIYYYYLFYLFLYLVLLFIIIYVNSWIKKMKFTEKNAKNSKKLKIKLDQFDQNVIEESLNIKRTLKLI